MILAVDIGNTHIVLGGVSEEKILFISRLATEKTKTGDQHGIEIKNVLEFYNIDVKKIKGSIISSVVPPVLNAYKGAIQKITGLNPLIVGPGIKTGLNILMDDPAKTGSDLIVSAIAALNGYKPPIAIIDMGTATTIAVVDENKNYIGGCIIPGVKISLNALSQNAAQLPDISLENPKKVIGKNTIECMRSGVINGNASMLDGMIQRIEDELGQHVTSIATGGIAKYIVPYCNKNIIVEENLIIKGLSILYNKNLQ